MTRILYPGSHSLELDFFSLLNRSERWIISRRKSPIKTDFLNATIIFPHLWMLLHLFLFTPKTNLCLPIERQQIECDKGNFLTIMMLVQAVSAEGMEMRLGTEKGILIDTMIYTMSAGLSCERKACQTNQIFYGEVKARTEALTL